MRHLAALLGLTIRLAAALMFVTGCRLLWNAHWIGQIVVAVMFVALIGFIVHTDAQRPHRRSRANRQETT